MARFWAKQLANMAITLFAVSFLVFVLNELSPGDVVRKLGACKLVTVASPAYLARHGRPLRPADLAGHECLAYTGDPNPSTWTYGSGERVETVYVRSRFSANNGDVLAEAAARGLGITLQPDFIAGPYLADGRLEQVLEACAPPELGVYALLPGTRHMPYRVRVLIEFLSERLRAASAGA